MGDQCGRLADKTTTANWPTSNWLRNSVDVFAPSRVADGHTQCSGVEWRGTYVMSRDGTQSLLREVPAGESIDQLLEQAGGFGRCQVRAPARIPSALPAPLAPLASHPEPARVSQPASVTMRRKPRAAAPAHAHSLRSAA